MSPEFKPARRSPTWGKAHPCDLGQGSGTKIEPNFASWTGGYGLPCFTKSRLNLSFCEPPIWPIENLKKLLSDVMHAIVLTIMIYDFITIHHYAFLFLFSIFTIFSVRFMLHRDGDLPHRKIWVFNLRARALGAPKVLSTSKSLSHRVSTTSLAWKYVGPKTGKVLT